MRVLNASRFREGAINPNSEFETAVKSAVTSYLRFLGLPWFFNRRYRRKHLLADLLIGFTVFGSEILLIESDRPANHDCDRIWRDFSSFWPRLKGTKNPHRDNWGQRLGNYHADPRSSLLDFAGQGSGSFRENNCSMPLFEQVDDRPDGRRIPFREIHRQRIDPGKD